MRIAVLGSSENKTHQFEILVSQSSIASLVTTSFRIMGLPHDQTIVDFLQSKKVPYEIYSYNDIWLRWSNEADMQKMLNNACRVHLEANSAGLNKFLINCDEVWICGEMKHSYEEMLWREPIQTYQIVNDQIVEKHRHIRSR